MAHRTWIQPVTLRGKRVTLEPLEQSHSDALAEVVKDGELWHLWVTTVPSPKEVAAYVQNALQRQQKEGGQAFVVRFNSTGKIIGTTRYLHADPLNQRLEIGATWYGQSFQRTAVNTESKLLLLTHGFEKLAAIAVEFRTHWHNHPSRNAIARLGAKQDGVLRQHARSPDGIYRDTVVFSILNSEWPAVKKNLQFKLEY